VERKSREDPIIDIRKVENNAIDYRLPIDSFNPGSNPEQINFYHTLSPTHHCYDFEVWPLAQSRRSGDRQKGPLTRNTRKGIKRVE